MPCCSARPCRGKGGVMRLFLTWVCAWPKTLVGLRTEFRACVSAVWAPELFLNPNFNAHGLHPAPSWGLSLCLRSHALKPQRLFNQHHVRANTPCCVARRPGELQCLELQAAKQVGNARLAALMAILLLTMD